MLIIEREKPIKPWWDNAANIHGGKTTREKFNDEWNTYALVSALVGASAFSVFAAGPNSDYNEGMKIAYGCFYGFGSLLCICAVWFNSRLIAFLNVIDDEYVVEATEKIFKDLITPNYYLMFIGFLLVLGGMALTAFSYNVVLGIMFISIFAFLPTLNMLFDKKLTTICWGRIATLAAAKVNNRNSDSCQGQ